MKMRKALSLVLLLVLALTLIPSAIAGSSTVVPVQAQQGTIKWQWETDSDACISSTPAIGPDGNIYVTAGVGGMSPLWVPERLFCISPQGSMLWKSQELDHSGTSDPVIGSDGTIYVVGYYKLYAFNPGGSLKWEWTTPEDGDPYPHAQICGATLGADGTIYTAHCQAGSYHRHLFALNPDGSMKWARDLADPDIGNGIGALTVGKDGVLYGQGTHWVNFTMYAFDPDNGAVLWSTELGSSVNQGGMAIGSDGTIYVPLAGGTPKLAAITPDGTIEWEYDMATPGIPSIGSDGTIYVTGGKLYALTSSGQLKWTASDGSAGAPEVAIASDGTIYSRLWHSEKEQHLLTAVNPDGSIKWTLDIPSWGGSPAIGSDGTIYVTGGCRPGVLTAVDGSGPLVSPDSDGDGVPNDNDWCDDTPLGTEVDEEGCPVDVLDSDGDGVPNDEDKCDDTRLGTEVDEYGCPVEVLDSDGDGVPNDEDWCDDTPLGTEVDEDGCPVDVLDSDGDGVPNDQDKCDDTPRGTEVDEYGCPVEVWASVCASAKIRIAGGSEFKHAKFTIGGTEPQEVRITQSAENFAIKEEYGGIVYQRIDGKSWGSRTLEPGTYILSCNGGGAMGLMSATVCIEYPVVEGAPEVKHPPKLPDPPGKTTKPSLPLGPIVKIVVRSADPNDSIMEDHLIMVIDQEKFFRAWGEDAAGNKRGVTVDEWKVNYEDRGSIKKDGLFKAGPKEGEVKIRATAEHITGVFRITVTTEPPITFVGRVEFFDEYGRRLKPLAGVQVRAIVQTSKSAAASFLDEVATVKTTSRGEFKFVLPAKFKDVDKWMFDSWGLKIPAPSGYVWHCYSASFYAPGKPGKTSHIDPIECSLNETKFWIEGMVTHHGKAVEDAKVRLFDNGKRVKETRSNYDGEFTLDVDNLPKGRYRLTVAQYKPPGPGNYVSVHNWLYIRKDRLVELPLKTETKTIDIEMISFAEKIGYTGP